MAIQGPRSALKRPSCFLRCYAPEHAASVVVSDLLGRDTFVHPLAAGAGPSGFTIDHFAVTGGCAAAWFIWKYPAL